ncbi:MAG: translation elongation factor Ts [Bacteroidetes bacterium]|nr:translation elongation factor Ts [Bacteroidota bacterium]
MTNITAEAVKTLRTKTGAGMMDCKKALEDANGNLDEAVELLRKKGIATAQKRADRVAKQGIVITKINPEKNKGIILEVNCETDFVGKNEEFISIATQIVNIIQEKNPQNLEELLLQNFGNGISIEGKITELIGKIGEKIAIRRFDIINSTNGLMNCYTHMGNKIGVLVELSTSKNEETTITLAKDIAMQVAAMNPTFINRSQVTKEVISQEIEIYKTQAVNEGKPEQIAEKIALGKLEKYYQEFVLDEQSFIKDAGKTITDIVKDASLKLGENVTIKRFIRYQLGE